MDTYLNISPGSGFLTLVHKGLSLTLDLRRCNASFEGWPAEVNALEFREVRNGVLMFLGEQGGWATISAPGAGSCLCSTERDPEGLFDPDGLFNVDWKPVSFETFRVEVERSGSVAAAVEYAAGFTLEVMGSDLFAHATCDVLTVAFVRGRANVYDLRVDILERDPKVATFQYTGEARAAAETFAARCREAR